MPYITKDAREALEFDLTDIGGSAETPGELNFLLTELLVGYLDEHGRSYGTINDILGALEGAKLEFYRRVVAPYEDKKIAENGDVY